MGVYLTIDLGTTHIKSAAWTIEGQLLACQREATPLEREGGLSFYCPEAVFQIVKEQIELLQKQNAPIRAIGITGMAEAGIILDRLTLKELSPILPWFEKITAPLAATLTEIEAAEAFSATGLRNSYKYGIYKLLWGIEHYGLSKENCLWLSLCDYLYFRLTGDIATEPTQAARTYGYNILLQQWDEERLEKYGLNQDNFPVLKATGQLLSSYQDNIPIALCGHDHLCAFEAINDGSQQICNSCGTAETYLKVFSGRPELFSDRGLVYGPYLRQNYYYAMANLPSSGHSLEWFRHGFSDLPLGYERIDQILAQQDGKISGIFFFPYLAGTGSPVFNGEAAGAFLGLKPQHGQGEILKSIIEGISYQSKWILEVAQFLGEEPLCVLGAPSQNPHWMQCKADIMNREIITYEKQEGTLYGALRLLMLQNNLASLPKLSPANVYRPRKDLAALYNQLYLKFYQPYAQKLSELTFSS